MLLLGVVVSAILWLTIHAQSQPDYYQILGLKRTASAKEIKSAYRKLALQYHPDKNPDTEDLFVQVGEAYAVLSDDEKRSVYDKYGIQGLESLERGVHPDEAGFGGFQQGGGFQHGGGSNFHFHSSGGRRQTFGGPDFDPFQMFEEMFAEQMRGGGHQQPPRDLFPKGTSQVSKLGSPKFPNRSSKHLWILMFYRNDSRECTQMAPVLEKLATSQTTFKVGAIDCGKNTQEASFCASKGITTQTIPRYALVVDGELTFYDEQESSTRPAAKDLKDFASDHLPTTLVQNINHVSQIAERLGTPIRKKVQYEAAILLLTDKYETSALYTSLAYYYRKSLILGESRAKNLALAKEFSVKNYPTLLALVPKGQGDNNYSDELDVIVYRKGSFKKEDLHEWIDAVRKRLQKKKDGKKWWNDLGF